MVRVYREARSLLHYFSTLAEGFIFVRTRFILRLIEALVFATFAAIFSQLIPPIGNINPFLIKALVTAISAWIGYMVFPEIARSVKIITLTLFNFALNKVSFEVSNQMVKIPRPNFSFGHPTPQLGAVALTRPLILDTSSIIDGRILEVAKAHFLSGLILIPRFVLTELQQVADSKDDLKRQRGRRGFEIVEELKKIKGIKIEVWDKDQNGKLVDDKIINLAKSLNGRILTCDFNLNKVAQVSNIAVLNINDLANALKTNAIPGQRLQIKIVHVGKDASQGVGYLDDGTMVVVANMADKIGQSLPVEVTKVLQGPAGKMIFGKVG